MIIASAQFRPIDEDIQQNLNSHYRLIRLAADNGAQFIAFPEMSVTGYIMESAKKLCFEKDDPRLDRLRELAVDNNMIVVAGAPIKIGGKLHIGSFIAFPDHSLLYYTKQYLHDGEENFFQSSFANNPIIHIDTERIGLAICADIMNPKHIESAYNVNCSLYVASIFYTSKGIDSANDLFFQYAKKYSMNILMSNFCGESYGLQAGGKSAMWVSCGLTIAKLDASSDGVVICKKDGSGFWSGMAIKSLC